MSYLDSVVFKFYSNQRRDRGDSSFSTQIGSSDYWIFHEEKVKKALFFGETTFVYAAPALLHLLGFFTAVYVFRIADNEQLQNLVERVCNFPNGFI